MIIGASGLVGGALLRALGAGAVGTYRTRQLEGLRRLDAADNDELRRTIREVRPEIVFFPAAEPNVDWCELHPDEAYAANVVPALAALEVAREHGAHFVFFSTDYVFDGERGPYLESDPVHPLSVYARHKCEVETRVLTAQGTVVRTAGVFGPEIAPAKNFVIRVLGRLSAGERVTAPGDQVSTPTWVDELAAASIKVAGRGGIWHVAGPELLARDQFARLVARVFGFDEDLVTSVTTPDLGQPARRPLLAGLRTDKLSREMSFRAIPLRASLERLRLSL